MHGGRTPTGIDVIAWVEEVVRLARARSCSRRWIVTARARASTSRSRGLGHRRRRRARDRERRRRQPRSPRRGSARGRGRRGARRVDLSLRRAHRRRSQAGARGARRDGSSGGGMTSWRRGRGPRRRRGRVTITAAACGDDSGNAARAQARRARTSERLPSQGECPPPNIATIDPAVLTVDAAPTAPLVHGQPANFKITLTNTSDAAVPLVFALEPAGRRHPEPRRQGGLRVERRPCLHPGAAVPDARRPGEAYTVELAETKPLPVSPGDYVLPRRSPRRIRLITMRP